MVKHVCDICGEDILPTYFMLNLKKLQDGIFWEKDIDLCTTCLERLDDYLGKSYWSVSND